MKNIVIDLLGADLPQEELVKGVLLAKERFTSYGFILVGDKNKLLPLVGESERIEYVDCKEAFSNNANPLLLAKGGDETSLAKALIRLRDDVSTIGMISAGATGGLIVGSIFKLGLLPGVKRPALMANLLSIKGRTVSLIDCGANTDVDAEKLVQLAHLGASFYEGYLGVSSPRVGLLNNGKEEHKGNKITKEAYQLLKDSDLNFVGNIEGNDVFLDKADVIACDGFAGNLILKNAEATAMIAKKMALSVMTNEEDKKKVEATIDHFFDYNDQGGAIILGCKKPVIKAHGMAKPTTIVATISDLVKLDEHHYLETLEKTQM